MALQTASGRGHSRARQLQELSDSSDSGNCSDDDSEEDDYELQDSAEDDETVEQSPCGRFSRVALDSLAQPNDR